MTTVYRNSTIVATARFYTAARGSTPSALADPDTVVFTLVDPDGTETAYTYPHASIEREAEGIYIFESPALDNVSRWHVHAQGVGNGVTVAGEADVIVRRSHIDP